MISLHILVEDTGRAGSSLEIEHGISYYIETPAGVLLFDFGATGMAFRNAEKLGLDLGKVRWTACSHAHYDHAGGFPALLNYVKPEALYTGQGFWNEKYVYGRTDGILRYGGAGFTKADLDKWGIRQEVVTGITQLAPEVHLVTSFPRIHEFETIPQRFVYGKDKKQDYFNDEIALVLKEGDGLAVIVGCSHPGILNIIHSIHERFQKPVYSVIGGTHLMEADDTRIHRTLAALKEMGLRRMGLCHCSGEAVRAMLEKDTVNGCALSTGDTVEF